MQPLIRIDNATVSRGKTRLAGPISIRVDRGEHVALVGNNGSGKTTLLRLLRGDILPDRGGERVYDFGDGPQHTVLGLRQRIGLVSADMQDFYLLHATGSLGRSVILAGFYDTPLLYGDATLEQEAATEEIIDQLRIRDLAESELGTLSTGQLRKLLVARALATKPDILLLDECLDGLDMLSRAEVLTLIEKASAHTTVVCAAHRIGDLPKGIERTIVMEAGRILSDGDLEHAMDTLCKAAPDSVACDLPAVEPPDEYDFLLRMENVSVESGGIRFLHNIHWEILPGEQWLVLGENGAGKSTLLRLITSETAPYADDEAGPGSIERLGGMTMDEARPRISVVSPALQSNYARELGWEVTALETVLSGYRGSVGMLDEPTSEELLGAREWLIRVGLGEYEERPLRRMSYGQQRRVFLARAMAPSPSLLLLDEPLSGLDAFSRGLMLDIMQRLADSGIPMVLVTHHAEDRMPAINQVMLLREGRQIFCGSRDEFEISQVMG